VKNPFRSGPYSERHTIYLHPRGDATAKRRDFAAKTGTPPSRGGKPLNFAVQMVYYKNLNEDQLSPSETARRKS
jgi:hypothetical protein